MQKKIIIRHVPFYFIRHGETAWNKSHKELCDQDDMPLNEIGLVQASNVCKMLHSLDITKIYSSPLRRAKQTAEIINQHLKVNLELNENLGKILDETIMTAFSEILESSHKMLIVSHGEVYRVLLKIKCSSR